jgi:CheY-like chemotaxis protein
MAETAVPIPELSAAHPAAADARVVGPARILIVDDEAAIRESLEALLSMEGFLVTLAGDGAAGLEQLAQGEFDLLLLDLALPGESGMDLLPRVLEMQPGLPVIMITAYGTVSNVVEAIRTAVGQREAAGGHSRGDWAAQGRRRSGAVEARAEAALQLREHRG